MKILVEPKSKIIENIKCDGLILALKDYAVESVCYYTIDEIKDIKKSDLEVFVKVNRNFFNEDIDGLKEVLKELDNIGVDGVFFYDLAVLQIKKELKLDLNLIWNQTHMVNNYRTCDYYYDKGVKYALLGKEITLDEICEIINKSKINCMVEVISMPSVAFSRRKLVTNYYKDLGKDGDKNLLVKEKVTGDFYKVIEDNYGTCFYLNKITNGTSVIKELYNVNCPYIILREYGIDNFSELVNDTYSYIKDGCIDSNYLTKYEKLGDSSNFFFKKTIYKVK